MSTESRRRFKGEGSLNDIWRITARGHLFKQKNKLEEQADKYLNPNAVGLKLVLSLIIGGWFLFLRVLSYGYPLMPDQMLADDSLRMAGIVMWWPIYALGVLTPWLAWSFARKLSLNIKIKRLDQQIYALKG